MENEKNVDGLKKNLNEINLQCNKIRDPPNVNKQQNKIQDLIHGF